IGVLFAGLMLTDDGPRVLEFNCRFRDPETQSLLPCLDGDVLTPLLSAAKADLDGIELAATDGAAVTVVLAAGEYPRAGDTGSPSARSPIGNACSLPWTSLTRAGSPTSSRCARPIGSRTRWLSGHGQHTSAA